MKEIIVKDIPKRTRVDLFIISFFPNITRSTAKKLILGGIVTLNENKVRPNLYVNENDIVRLDLDRVRDFLDNNGISEIKPVKMDLKITFEDENTLILDKNIGVPVHPSYMHNEDTLMNGLTYYVVHESLNPFGRIRPVNRLDKDTSGVILFSKNLDAHNFYTRQFKKREVEKTYLALVQGDFKFFLDAIGKESIVLQNHISKLANDLIYKVSDSTKGDLAETEFYFEKYIGEYSLVRAVPKTGRTHQIRVHLKYLGFPIIGDKLYGGMEYKRLMLHAWKLKFKLFNESESKEFEAEVPLEFRNS